MSAPICERCGAPEEEVPAIGFVCMTENCFPVVIPMARILVCGGRRFDNWLCVDGTLRAFSPAKIHIITGGATGADALAESWARDNGVPFTVFPANWTHYGRAAGPIRNTRMLDEGRPDFVIAFPGGNGTDDMVRKAKARGLKVMEVKP